jgi:hypothetical protein
MTGLRRASRPEYSLLKMWDGWHTLDRAIDESAMQSVLARGWVSLEYANEWLSLQVGYRPCVTGVCDVEGCGLLADGQAC